MPSAIADPCNKKLSSVYCDFLETTGFSLKLAVELECYLNAEADITALQSMLEAKASDFNITLGALNPERGKQQYEIHTLPTNSPTALAQAIGVLREVLASQGNIAAKPFTDQPGNGMHIHVSLWDAENRPLFAKSGEEETPVMRYAIGGLLSRLPHSMAIFAPTKDSLKRFDGSNDVPSTISWGGNNRTVAIRIPDSSGDPESRHIEHRVPGMDADPYLTLMEIILGIQEGLSERITPATPKIWGNATDAQYGLKALVG